MGLPVLQLVPEDDLRAIVASCTGPFALVADDGQLLHLSPDAAHLFDASASDLPRLRCFDLVAGRDAFGNPFCGESCAVMRLARTGEAARPFELSTPRGRMRAAVHLLRSGGRHVMLYRWWPEQLAALPPATGAPDLTSRERDVLRALARGLTTGDIAGELGISPTTVRNHVQALLRKHGAHTRAELVSLAFRQRQV